MGEQDVCRADAQVGIVVDVHLVRRPGEDLAQLAVPGLPAQLRVDVAVIDDAYRAVNYDTIARPQSSVSPYGATTTYAYNDTAPASGTDPTI